MLGFLILYNVRKSNVLPAGGTRPPLNKLPNGQKWMIDDIDDGEIRERYGFDSKQELHRLHDALG
jgi:hypothetical protein